MMSVDQLEVSVDIEVGIRVTEEIYYPILLVFQLGNVVASMAQYGQYGTIDATTLANRYPMQFLDM